MSSKTKNQSYQMMMLTRTHEEAAEVAALTSKDPGPFELKYAILIN